MTPDKILVFAPRFDTATEYSFEWGKDLIGKFSEDITTLLEADATQRNYLKGIPGHDVFIFFDHGIDDGLIDQNMRKFVNMGNVDTLKDKRVYTMACLSAKVLGVKAYHEGCLEYWGATDAITFTIDDAHLFGEVFVDGAYARFGEGKSIDEVFQSMREHFILQKTKTNNPWTKIWLEKDRDMWIVWHAGNPPPEPEPPKPWWVRLWEWLKDLLGFNAMEDYWFEPLACLYLA
ncbi:unnamed protein product [marine sediment metagenome]|uniref:Gingipain domain-containing protein n=1 Tax=marine sediment metagenome TaxID=412755 RepID=X0SLA1_9ZZZZ